MRICCEDCGKGKHGDNLIPVYNNGKIPEKYLCEDCLGSSSEYGECDWCKGDGRPRLAYEVGELNEEDNGLSSCHEHCGSGHELTDDEQSMIEYFNKN